MKIILIGCFIVFPCRAAELSLPIGERLVCPIIIVAVGIVLALALACRYGQRKIPVLLDFSCQTERDIVQQRVRRAIVLEIDERGRISIVCKTASESFTPMESACVRLGARTLGGVSNAQKPIRSAPSSFASVLSSFWICTRFNSFISLL